MSVLPNVLPLFFAIVAFIIGFLFFVTAIILCAIALIVVFSVLKNRKMRKPLDHG